MKGIPMKSAAIALEKLFALAGREVKITMIDGSSPAGELTDIRTQGLVINDGTDSEVLWPSSVELDRSFTYPLSSIKRIDLSAAYSEPTPRVVKRPPPKPPKPEIVKPSRVHKFKAG